MSVDEWEYDVYEEVDDEDDEASICPYCGAVRRWCDVCNMWTCFGCEDYGTCECS